MKNDNHLMIMIHIRHRQMNIILYFLCTIKEIHVCMTYLLRNLMHTRVCKRVVVFIHAIPYM